MPDGQAGSTSRRMAPSTGTCLTDGFISSFFPFILRHYIIVNWQTLLSGATWNKVQTLRLITKCAKSPLREVWFQVLGITDKVLNLADLLNLRFKQAILASTNAISAYFAVTTMHYYAYIVTKV